MKFNYYKVPLSEKENSGFFGSWILKPIVPIGVTCGDKKIRYAALVDSGADFCIFSAEVGEYLGLDVRKGLRHTFGGIQVGNPSEVFFHEVTLNVGGWDHQTKIGFSYDIAPRGYGVLGQKGFFDGFFVGFDFSKEEIELKKKNKG
jgi:hypothetical protein